MFSGSGEEFCILLCLGRGWWGKKEAMAISLVPGILVAGHGVGGWGSGWFCSFNA